MQAIYVLALFARQLSAVMEKVVFLGLLLFGDECF